MGRRDRGGHQRGPADQAGLRAWVVIQSAGRAPTPDARALSRAGRRCSEDKVTVAARGGQHLTVQVTLGELPGS